MKLSYPELEGRSGRARISSIAYAEEDAFRQTLRAGTTIFDTAAQGSELAGRVGGRTVRRQGFQLQG
jgi:alanyl-tRNA synthetase